MRNQCRLHKMMTICPTAKTSTHSGQLYLYIFPRNPQATGKRSHNKIRRLCRPVNDSLVTFHICKGIHWFHGIVCQKRSGISTFNHFSRPLECTFGIPIFSSNLSRLSVIIGHIFFMNTGAFQSCRNLHLNIFSTSTCHRESTCRSGFPFCFNTFFGLHDFPS